MWRRLGEPPAPYVARKTNVSVEVPKVNVTPNKDGARDYRSYYSDEMREMIAAWYAPEIKLLG